MADKPKKVAAAKWTREGAVFTIAWGHGPVDTVDVSKWTEEVRECCMLNGAKQTLSDAYALPMVENTVDGKKVTRNPTPEEKRAAFLERKESLDKGTYREGRGEGEPRAYVMLAMQRLYPKVFAVGKTDEENRAVFDKFVETSCEKKKCDEKALLKSLREDKRVAPEIMKIKAEKGIVPMAVDDILAEMENLPEDGETEELQTQE